MEQLQVMPNPHTPLRAVPSLQSARPVILHCGRDLTLLSSRSRVLALTGTPVERCHGLQQLDVLFPRYTRGLLVLCHSLTEAELREAINRMKTLPAFTGLVLTKGYSAPLAGVETASTNLGPHGLLQAAAALLAAQSHSKPQWASA